jgi:hypothetical protein
MSASAEEFPSCLRESEYEAEGLDIHDDHGQVALRDCGSEDLYFT